MHYFNTKTTKEETFVLFHGTGGNEYSLLFLTGELDAKVSVMSFLGEVGTGVERRFFNPLIDGKLDREDFNLRVDQFLTEWADIRPKEGKITFVGYSNGANFILGLLAKEPNLADKIVLLHPSQLDYQFPTDLQSEAKILMTAGANDYIVSPGTVLALSKELEPHFSDVDFTLLDQGHEVTDGEVDLVKKWYARIQ